MVDEHPNLALLQSLDLRDLASAKDIFSEDFVWHFINPQLPNIQGDFVGVEGLMSFFGALQQRTGGSFSVEPISSTVFGDNLVVSHVKDRMNLDGRTVEPEAVVIWRFRDGRIAEAWDVVAVLEPHVAER